MITTEEFKRAMTIFKEYRKALRVIEQYHRQFSAPQGAVRRRATLCEFVRATSLSTRLKNVLSQFPADSCLEEIERNALYRLRNCGLVSWEEFSAKRREYLAHIKKLPMVE